MNKAEFKAIKMIAEKLNWQAVNFEVIKQMIRNQQSLELDCIGECDDEEETLLSIALWDTDKILSTTKVFDFESMVEWRVDTFCEDMGMDYLDFRAMMEYYEVSPELLAADYEAEYEAYLEDYYSDYEAEIMRDVMWMNHNC